jgi:uncharacterized protein (DUF1778 family)
MPKKSEQIWVRLNPGDRQAIELASLEYGLSMSEFVRYCAATTARKVVADLKGIEEHPISQVRQMPWVQDTFRKVK